MRFRDYLLEELSPTLEYKKAVFDLRVAVKELKFWEKETRPSDPSMVPAFDMKGVNLKTKIIRLKEKIQKMLTDLGESADPSLEKLLSVVPDKESNTYNKLQKEKDRLGVG